MNQLGVKKLFNNPLKFAIGITLVTQFSLVGGACAAGIPEDGRLPPSAPPIVLTPSKSFLIIGESLQLKVETINDDGTKTDVTNDPNTLFEISNISAELVSLSSDGRVTGKTRGIALISATFMRAADSSMSNILEIQVRLPGDTDNDGMPDSFEKKYSLDPNNPIDAKADNDLDTLTNLKEYESRTNPNNPDTDGDSYNDAYELSLGMDPNTKD